MTSSESSDGSDFLTKMAEQDETNQDIYLQTPNQSIKWLQCGRPPPGFFSILNHLLNPSPSDPSHSSMYQYSTFIPRTTFPTIPTLKLSPSPLHPSSKTQYSTSLQPLAYPHQPSPSTSTTIPYHTINAYFLILTKHIPTVVLLNHDFLPFTSLSQLKRKVN